MATSLFPRKTIKYKFAAPTLPRLNRDFMLKKIAEVYYQDVSTFCKAAGLNKTSFYMHIRGVSLPTVTVLARITAALKMPPETWHKLIKNKE